MHRGTSAAMMACGSWFTSTTYSSCRVLSVTRILPLEGSMACICGLGIRRAVLWCATALRAPIIQRDACRSHSVDLWYFEVNSA